MFIKTPLLLFRQLPDVFLTMVKSFLYAKNKAKKIQEKKEESKAGKREKEREEGQNGKDGKSEKRRTENAKERRGKEAYARCRPA